MTSDIDSVVNQAIEDGRIVGTTVAVAHRGETVYRRDAGLADREAGRPLPDEPVYLLASVTKPFTSVAVMGLVTDGVLDLSAPVTAYLPDFRPALADGTRPEITLRHLLTHTAGLSYRFFAEQGTGYDAAGVSDGFDQRGLPLAENLRRIASAPLVYAPGTSWEYSLALDVLGGVVEAATGNGLDKVIAERVTEPLGIAETGFFVADPARRVAHYVDTEGPVRRLADHGEDATPVGPGRFARFAVDRLEDPASYPSGGAGMAGTASDVLRFLEAVRTGEILPPGVVDEMARVQVGQEAATEGPGWGFGYGWAVLVDPAAAGSPQPAGTLQWAGAYGHKWFVDRANELTVVALTNTTFEGMRGAFTTDLRDAIYREVL